MKQLIIEKYGEPDIDICSYLSPYEESDGYETTAISLGKGTLSAGWKFSINDWKQEFDSNFLGIEINTELKIVITYQNGVLIQDVVAKQRDGFKNDL